MNLNITIPGNPATKKNSGVIARRKNGTPFVLPSKRFREYQDECAVHLAKYAGMEIETKSNVCVRYYMQTRRRVDLANLIEATCDILTHYGVLKDDNSSIVASHDGSLVLYDKENPRIEIEITEIA